MERYGTLRESDDGQHGNLLDLPGYLVGRPGENPAAIVVIRSHFGRRLARVAYSRERKLRVPQRKFPVVQRRRQGDLLAGGLGHAELVMNCVRGAGRDQPNVNQRASGPGVALVDGIAVRIRHQGAIEMRALLDRACAAVSYAAAPEQHLTFFVGGLELQPAVKGVHRATGKEVAHLTCAHDHVHANRVAAADEGFAAIQRRGHWQRFDGGARGWRLCLFADRECGGELRARQLGALSRGPGGRQREDVHADNLVLQELLGYLALLGILIGVGQRCVRPGETVGVHESVDVAHIVGRHQRHMAIGALLGFRRIDRKSTRLNSSHGYISYAVFCLKKKKKKEIENESKKHKKKEFYSPTKQNNYKMQSILSAPCKIEAKPALKERLNIDTRDHPDPK